MQEFVFLHQHSVRTEFERKINSGQIKKSEREERRETREQFGETREVVGNERGVTRGKMFFSAKPHKPRFLKISIKNSQSGFATLFVFENNCCFDLFIFNLELFKLPD